MSEFILPIIVAGIIAALVMSVYLLFRNMRERRLEYWKRRLSLPEEQEESLVSTTDLPGQKTTWNKQVDENFDRMIHRTGLGVSPEQAIGWILLIGIVFGGLVLLWRSELWLGGLAMLIGMALPLSYYLILQARWRRLLRNQIPDTLYLLARSLRSGLSLEQALENVAENGNQPMADEFKRGVRQIQLGLTVPAALKGMGRRIKLEEFDIFVTIITLHRNIGGNLTLLLERVATSIRDRNLFRGYFRTATALARVTAFALAAGAPAIFIMYSFWQPDFVTRFTGSESGIRLLTAAAVLELIGITWVSFLLRSRY